MPYRKLLLSAVIICVLTPGVSAQETDSTEAPTRLEEIVVIGSRIQGRSITDSPVPVDLIKQEDMRNTGQLEVGRAIQRLIPSFNFSSSTISDGTDAVRPATLRGMGPDQVLVLLNGKRRHGSALIHVNTSVGRGNTGTDMNAIPMAQSNASKSCGTEPLHNTVRTPSPESSTSSSRTITREGSVRTMEQPTRETAINSLQAWTRASRSEKMARCTRRSNIAIGSGPTGLGCSEFPITLTRRPVP